MATQKSSLIRQFPEKHRELVRRILERDGGKLSRSQFYSQTKKRESKEIEKYSGLMFYDLRLRNLNEHYGCSDDEAEAMAAARIYGQQLLRRGLARRIVHDDPAELEAALWLATRIEWIESCPPSRLVGERYPEIWIILRGLAAGDLDVARAFFGPRPRKLSGGHKSTVLVYNTVQAIVTKNQRAQSLLRPELEYANAPDCDRAILRTLHGIISADATAVAVNLERVVATFHRTVLQEEEKVIAILAHGLAELAHWVSPGLLAEFDLDRPLPWDSGYHRWLHRRNRSTKYRDMSMYSALLHRWIHDLEEPAWWHHPTNAR
jgi:hypothetical protein